MTGNVLNRVPTCECLRTARRGVKLRAMRTIHRLAAVVLAIPCLSGCSNSRGSSTAPDTPVNPNIEGVVVSMVGLAVEGAKVEVTTGSRAGVSATTDGGGRFSLTGVQGTGAAVSLKVTKAGYDDAVFGNTVESRPDNPLKLVIYPTSRDPASTRFTVSLGADPACGMLPDEVRSRTYRAEMEVNKRQDGSADFRMPLDGADFYPTQRVMWGMSGAFGANVTFYVSSAEAADRWLEEDPIVEHLGGTRYVAIVGQGSAVQPAAPGQTVTVPFGGTFSYCTNGGGDVLYSCNGTPIECKSSNHHLTLTLR